MIDFNDDKSTALESGALYNGTTAILEWYPKWYLNSNGMVTTVTFITVVVCVCVCVCVCVYLSVC